MLLFLSRPALVVRDVMRGRESEEKRRGHACGAMWGELELMAVMHVLCRAPEKFLERF